MVAVANPKTILRHAWRVIPMILVMGGILYLSSQGGDSFIRKFQGYDKILHALAYGALAVSTLVAVQPLRGKIPGFWLGMATILFCAAFGVLDEWYQSHIPRRIVDSQDVLADTTGAISVVSIWLLKSLRF